MDNGAIVHVEYALYNAESGDLIETTREEIAKEHDVFDEARTYEPMITVVGEGRLIAGCEAHLSDAEADNEYTFDIEPTDAYGERDASLVETISQNVLLRSVGDPNMLAIGAPVEIGGRNGILQMLRAGRARIDYNHPMAGRTLKYDYKIVKVIEGKEEKVAALLEANTGQEGFEVSFDGDDISIVVPQTMLFDPNAAMQKFRLVTVLRDAVEAGKVSFVEVHEPRVAAEDDHDHGEEE